MLVNTIGYYSKAGLALVLRGLLVVALSLSGHTVWNYFQSELGFRSTFNAIDVDVDVEIPRRERFAAMRDSALLTPDNADIFQAIGWLEYHSGRAELSRQYLAKSLYIRPAWAYSWIDLVKYHARQGEFGAHFVTSVRRAQSLGPSERAIQSAIALVGIRYWYEMPSEARMAVDSSIEFSLKYLRHSRRTQFLKSASSMGRKKLLCIKYSHYISNKSCRREGVYFYPSTSGKDNF